jgi:hypothetical protein
MSYNTSNLHELNGHIHPLFEYFNQYFYGTIFDPHSDIPPKIDSHDTTNSYYSEP